MEEIQPANVEEIEKTVAILLADYERQNGFLSRAQVDRIIEKRGLKINECSEVFKQLDDLGVTQTDETEEYNSDLFNPEELGITASNETNQISDQLLHRLHTANYGLLTANEEIELGQQMELGRRAQNELDEGGVNSKTHIDIINRAKKAQEQMILSNIGLVFSVARPYAGVSDLLLEDLAQEGVFGLVRATNKYDYTLGYKFSTYATWWIRSAITRAIADRGATIRVPVHVYEDVYKLKKTCRLLLQTHPERSPSIAEIMFELVWTADKVHFIQQLSRLVPVPLDKKLSEQDEATLIDTLYTDIPSPEEQYGQTELTTVLDETLSTMDPREQNIIEMRFGLNDQIECKTLDEIGKMYGVTRERIRQIQEKALRKLRRPSRGDRLRTFLENDSCTGRSK